ADVRDDGPGIRPELLDRLFIPFERLGAEATDVEGTGLGLALSKGLMEAMGGNLGVESVLGQGSTFFVGLPFAEAPAVDEEGEGAMGIAIRAPAATSTIVYVERTLANLKRSERA